MTDKPKRMNFLGALGDFTILVLLIGGAGLGGYYIGINQRLAPIQYVYPGTPGAVPLSQVFDSPQANTVAIDSSKTVDSSKPATSQPATQTSPTTTAITKPTTAPAKPAASQKKQSKFWLTSSGVDNYNGYSITVKVNGETVDNFFGAGKTIDVTKFVKKGDNSLEFVCKYLGDEYNKHKGEKNAALTVQLVTGPSIREDYPQSSVLLSCRRDATETQDFSEKKNFTSKD
ncbi:MAG: hypothetical protein SGJ27_25345 [Candidatus Melainabacteria bacterium]|nr:hypothetical protein [Candidatus Melainabacteria bacterium]